MKTRTFRCIRCGVGVFKLNAVCRDCADVDPKVAAAWRADTLQYNRRLAAWRAARTERTAR